MSMIGSAASPPRAIRGHASALAEREEARKWRRLIGFMVGPVDELCRSYAGGMHGVGAILPERHTPSKVSVDHSPRMRSSVSEDAPGSAAHPGRLRGRSPQIGHLGGEALEAVAGQVDRAGVGGD